MKRHPPERPDKADSDLEIGNAALEWAVADGAATRIAEHARNRGRRIRRRRQILAIAAGAGFLFSVSQIRVWHRGITGEIPAGSSISVTAPAMQVLPDGTVVELRDAAQIVTEFSPAVRRVILTRGEAYFQVAHNRERPFVVAANGVDVRAVGTAFSVQLGSRAVEVLVTSGQVQIERFSPAAREVASLSPALVDSGTSITVPTQAIDEPPGVATQEVRKTVSMAEVSTRLSWRVPRIELSGTPLSEAIPLFNRHSPIPLVMDDPAIGRLQLSGVLRPDNPDALLRILWNDFRISAERHGDDRIVLRRH